ncbi:MAG: NHL repeat-containing protein [Armatimonadetes bacterium]|nr:NHL repeat-containing protein [Armatimonadota bacterium]
MTRFARRGEMWSIYRAAGAALCCVLLAAGCARRNEVAGLVETGLERIQQAEDTPVSVDPALLTWSETGTLETGMDEPRGIAFDRDGRLYVAGDREVRVLDPDGTVRGSFAVAGEPRAIAVGAWLRQDRAVFVTLIEKLLVYSPDGVLIDRWDPPGDRNYLTCVTVSDRTAYVADAGERVVIRHSPEHEADLRFGEKDEARGIPGLVCPSPHLDVVVSADGNVIIANPGRHRVETYSPRGDLLSFFGRSSLDIGGFGGCCNPTDLALLPDGKIVTSEKGVARVKVYTPGGKLESVVATPERMNTETKGLDLAVDAAGRIFVLDSWRRVIRTFQRNEAPSDE